MNDPQLKSNSVPIWFWVISAIGLFWFLMDFMAFYMRVFTTEQTLEKMPEAQRALYQAMPSWVNIVFALEVFGGLLGCVMLLLRRKWATALLAISFIGVVCQSLYIWFMSDAIDVMGSMAIVMPPVAFFIGLSLYFFSKFATVKGWLR